MFNSLVSMQAEFIVLRLGTLFALKFALLVWFMDSRAFFLTNQGERKTDRDILAFSAAFFAD